MDQLVGAFSLFRKPLSEPLPKIVHDNFSPKGSLRKLACPIPLQDVEIDYTNGMPGKSQKRPSNLSTGNKISKNTPAWRQILLALTLVPLVAGGVLILLWAFDVFLWQPPDNQLTVAVLFVFFSFSASNFLQGKWLVGLGWFLLMIADGILLSQVRGTVQIAAIVVGIIALIIFAVEIILRLRSQRKTK